MKNKIAIILAGLIQILLMMNLLIFKNIPLIVTILTSITMVIIAGKLLSNVILESKNN
ncbi:putative membrane protein [[Clostridium] sordellii ATCC 9714]|uniref:Uncharacterized protein n=1 Tax=Paraclostridium sordellii TaxID=1505 RepID=A0ABM9RTU8_PARSO|nr:hypothetical protein [Paeniclostridium sordellii]EPZ62080.1 putative membrane protein [[Clostridium] sordellii ATCC 9714] [Paeniclostridium sordellii ATCC 9714]CEJ75519.1 hypothetical protein ATCC9714PCS11_00601 (plasmid) [[Clostridium] sordellii] [Paeniclostridium sordellii]CEN22477.1 Uncharacterised protein [[Clostridium] sordellii] [Paeniclostridium sordellii]CEN29718.1 Uncharacterised protein [[Clostridium] sordellii] [Paeniclostridium sordellii]